MIITQNSPEIIECKPEYINQKHWQEWVDSGVKPSIIAANIYTEEDARELDKVLNRNSTKRWKHSNNLVPAWVVRGVYPESGEIDLGGVQAKPDNPEDRNGKTQKYLGASEYGAFPLFLKVEDFDYWLKVIQDLNIPVIITEGAKKAACLLSNGYAAISVPGVSTCRKKGRIHKLLKKFCGFGRTFYLGFDNDVVTKRPVQLALTNLARDLSATGSKVMVICLPDGEAKGIDDYIVANSTEAFQKLFEQAKTIEEWKDDNDLSWAAYQEKIKNKKKSKLARAIETMQTAWGSFLKWNELTQAPELGEEKLEADDLRVKIALELDMDVNQNDSVHAIRKLAKENCYHPIKEYLEDVAEINNDVDINILNNLSTELFGNDSQICNLYLKYFLIGSVARIMRPGAKFDNAIILYGAEGLKKSTFWKDLYGENWFSDSMSNGSEKDEKMLLHEHWCLEWSEFSTVYKHKDLEELKSFLAKSEDSFRKPYERAVSKHKRRCVFVGTTNKPEVLQDPSGRNRRFWIINVNKQIDLEKVKEIRDQVWAAAYHCWKRGDIYYIAEGSKEAQMQDKENIQYRASHPWQEILEEFLFGKSQTYMGELFDHLEIEKGRRESRHERQVIECLKILGWEKSGERPYIKGCRRWTWVKIRDENNNSSRPVDYKPHKAEGISNTDSPGVSPPVVHQQSTPTKDTEQLSVFNSPLEKNSPQEDSEVDYPESPVDKPYSQDSPPVHQNNEKEEIIIRPDSSFKENKSRLMKIKGITGQWKAKYRIGSQHIHLKYRSPDGREGVQMEFVEITPRLNYEYFRELVERAIWELEKGLLSDRTFRIQMWLREGVDELEPRWLSGCKLTSVPDPGYSQFHFETPDGEIFEKFGLEEFELEEPEE